MRERESSRAVMLAMALVYATLAIAGPALAQGADIVGHFHSIWIDELRRGSPGRVAHFVTTDEGRTYEVQIEPSLLARAGGLRALGGRQVRVLGTRVAGFDTAARRPPALRAIEIQPLGVPPTSPRFDLQGASPRAPSAYLTILCKFADSTSVEPRSRAAYEELMLGSRYPDLPHFWGEITGGYVSIAGSRVVGWYVMPHPKSYYFGTKPDGTMDVSGGATRQDLLQQDCLDAADPDVDFNQYAGINVQYNGFWEVAVGGGWWLTRDGTSRNVGMTWLPSWASSFVYAHEMGHSLGLPHSSTPYEASYGAFWDFMSQGRFWDEAVKDEVPSGTIAYHHMRLGSIPEQQIVTPAPGTRQTLDLAFLNTAMNAGDATPRTALLPLGGTAFYTLEARRKAGPYDKWIPSSGVLLYRVDTVATPDRDWVPARLVDIDRNGNPNDAGAAWTPGETWTDSTAGYSFTVLSESGTGFRLSVRRGYAATVALRGHGSVSNGATHCSTAPCEFLVAVAGQSLSLQAVPDSGEQFLGWTDGCTGTEATCTLSLHRDVTATARFGRPIAIPTSKLRNGVAGQRFADTLRADGGVDSISWELAEGTLPPGLALVAATGVIAGTPVAAGTFTLSLRARSEQLSTTKPLELVIEAPLVIASEGKRPTALIGVAYADTLRATGGVAGGTTWRVSDGQVPVGLSLSQDGVLAGQPGAAGTFSATLVIESPAQRTTQGFEWNVLSAFAVVSDSARPRATMGASMRDSLAATAGVADVHWRVAEGALPAGVTLAESGLIAGIPEQTGDFHFSVEASTRTAHASTWRASRRLSLTVVAPAVSATDVLDHVTGVHTLSSDVVRYFDLLGNRNQRLDIGDIAAWLEATGQVSSPVATALLANPAWIR